MAVFQLRGSGAWKHVPAMWEHQTQTTVSPMQRHRNPVACARLRGAVPSADTCNGLGASAAPCPAWRPTALLAQAGGAGTRQKLRAWVAKPFSFSYCFVIAFLIITFAA